ncbi:helix-turn-helix domain-containing protein [Neisseria chenwenguii]|uniref:Transcriptional regulator n=1 Tax=Neisseria chenwenguii TaxID=1853278 RepID=A0A220S206_9NEIS|nr:type II toxin-antitoxin system MqsA family antitoxin [Neisseria chenwenguii]ASK27514.1 transcriptional regulator [Neisseria chenwenguii]ROV55594.1 helix-turn-helix domain-containing protein [Neisseria chenwenguii]
MNLKDVDAAEHEFTGAELGELLLESVRQMKAGEVSRVCHVAVSEAVKARHKTGMSQSEFAKVLGVSVRTLQGWEQGRRQPSGAAATLLKIASRHPEALLELR